MKNWHTLEPDFFALMKKHYTPGRGGHKVTHVVLHHMAMVGGAWDCWRVWQDRAASAHFCIDPKGVIGQTVLDNDTAWANANALANSTSITIEHSNSAGAALNWPISEATLEAGAHLVAAVCVRFNLGMPTWGKNVKGHGDYFATSCPYHLRKGNMYHDRYMARAQFWYTTMLREKNAAATNTKELSMADINDLKRHIDAAAAREREALFNSLTTFMRGYLGPGLSDVKDIREQLVGGRDAVFENGRVNLAKSYPGWKILGTNALGKPLTVTDALSAMRHDDSRALALLEKIAAAAEKGGKNV